MDEVDFKKNATVIFFFFLHICNPLIKLACKTLSNVTKTFFGYFNALKTNCVFTHPWDKVEITQISIERLRDFKIILAISF